jgi:hypothetical protein
MPGVTHPLHDMPSQVNTDVSRNEMARSKNCVMPPPTYTFYFKGKFSATTTHLFKFIYCFFFRFSLPLKYFLQDILDIYLITVDT